MFAVNDIAVYYCNRLGKQKRYGKGKTIVIKKGFTFKVTEVHSSGFWVKDATDKWHAIWFLRKATQQEIN